MWIGVDVYLYRLSIEFWGWDCSWYLTYLLALCLAIRTLCRDGRVVSTGVRVCLFSRVLGAQPTRVHRSTPQTISLGIAVPGKGHIHPLMLSTLGERRSRSYIQNNLKQIHVSGIVRYKKKTNQSKAKQVYRTPRRRTTTPPPPFATLPPPVRHPSVARPSLRPSADKQSARQTSTFLPSFLPEPSGLTMGA